MNAQRILQFLKDIASNNNREWFYANKAEYEAVRKDFNDAIAVAIGRIAEFDDSIAHVTVKDTVYRFNRDTRFSPDKSPYKRHLGAYINAKGNHFTEDTTYTWNPTIVCLPWGVIGYQPTF